MTWRFQASWSDGVEVFMTKAPGRPSCGRFTSPTNIINGKCFDVRFCLIQSRCRRKFDAEIMP